MRRSCDHKATRPGVTRALSMVEAVISIVVVGVMLVAALNTVAAARLTEQKTGERTRGLLLAEDLMSEILRQHYEDPDLAPGSFGLGGDEVGDGSRALWEDVDDYDGWSASPPQQKDGTELVDFKGWTRSVVVRWADPNDLSQKPLSDAGVKWITVTVTDGNTAVISLDSVRTNGLRFD